MAVAENAITTHLFNQSILHFSACILSNLLHTQAASLALVPIPEAFLSVKAQAPQIWTVTSLFWLVILLYSFLHFLSVRGFPSTLRDTSCSNSG